MKTSSIRRLSAQIRSLEQRIEELRSSAEKCTGVLDDMPRAAHAGDRVSEAAVKLVTLQNEYANKKIALEHVRDELIDKLTPTEAEIVELRDIDGLGWDDIAKKTAYCERQCRRLHRSATQKMSDNVR